MSYSVWLAKVRAHFNEPMLSRFDLVRCVGYGEDESDCYIIVRRPNPDADLIWHTMVGGYTFLDRLKGQNYVRSTSGEDWDDLTRLDDVLALNGAPREPNFILGMVLKSIPEHLLDGLPEEDQASIRAAIGNMVTVVGHDEIGRAEVEFVDAAGDIHTIWIDPAMLSRLREPSANED